MTPKSSSPSGIGEDKLVEQPVADEPGEGHDLVVWIGYMSSTDDFASSCHLMT
jgi:hypothetical protein